MKLYGVFGKGSGKVGNSVWAISGGEQIVRPYNPNVTNPNTDAQVAQRAKLKLMSQLAAAMSPVLAFKKQGLVSARNQFVSRNIGLCTYTDADGAKCDILSLDITGGQIALPNVVWAAAAMGLDVNLAARPAANIKRVLYAAFGVDADEKLVFMESALVTVAGDDGTFPTNMQNAGETGFIFAYGIADENAAVTKKFEDYLASLADSEAALEVVSYIKASQASLSVTKAAQFHTI